MSMLSNDSVSINPCLFAIGKLSRAFGGLKGKLKYQRSRSQAAKASLKSIGRGKHLSGLSDWCNQNLIDRGIYQPKCKGTEEEPEEVDE